MAATKKAEPNSKSTNRLVDFGLSKILKPEILEVRIVGLSPLLQNNPAAFITNTGDEVAAGKKKYIDEEEAKLRVYQDSDGSYYHPADSFRNALIRSASGKKIGNVALTTLFSGAVFLTEPYAFLEDEKGKPLTKYTIDRRPVVVNKARILRARPCWPKWSVRIAFEVDSGVVSPQVVSQFLMLAGRIVGVGDFRPEKKGSFGRFKVETK